MSVTITADCENIDWNEACRVFERAPLGTREPEKLEQAFKNTGLVRFAWDGPILVGLCRAMTDGIFQAAIYDLCILPEYQGTGLGRRIMESIMDECEGMTVVLYAVPTKIGFYEKFGFETMSTGMARFGDQERMRALGYLVER